MLHRSSVVAASLVLSSLLAACSFINAPDEVRPGDGTGGSDGSSDSASSSSASSSNSSSASSSSSSGTSSSSSSSGSSTASSSSSGTMMVCSPGQTQSCYDGPNGTQGVGLCQGGTRTCDPSGASWGPCQGQVLPVQENCNTFLVDEDCDGLPKNGCPTRVLFASAIGNPDDQQVISSLAATGAFALVNLYDAQNGTPTLNELMGYDVVLSASNYPYSNPALLGNVLADYYDAGGRVVLAAFATTDALPMGGRFGDTTQGYMLINPPNGYNYNGSGDTLGQVAEPQSPLMAGVNSISATFNTNGEPINGGVAVARFNTGVPLVVRGVVKGRNRADINFFPPASFCSGDCIPLLRNALLYQ